MRFRTGSGSDAADLPGGRDLRRQWSALRSHHLFPIETEDELVVQYVASPFHCATVRMHVWLDGAVRTVTDWLGAGETSGWIDLGPVARGRHLVGLQAEGIAGGCNERTMLGWGGEFHVQSGTLARPDPEPPRRIEIELHPVLRLHAPVGSTVRIEIATDPAAGPWQSLTNVLITTTP